MLFARIKACLARHAMLTPGLTLAVGVSGGPDSIALLHLLTRLRDDYRLSLIAAHLDHGLRPESGREAEFVARTAEGWGVAAVCERADVRALAHERGLSIEEAGRAARYEFFARLAPAVAVAHNLDDQAETVLMHFLRGSGIGGLRGMLPVSRPSPAAGRQLTVIRPLLDVPRSDIEAYIARHSLPFVTDPSNTDRAYFRNRLRHDLLPHLEGYNPNIRQILARTAEVMRGDYELLRGVVEKAWDETAAPHPSPTVIHFNLSRFRRLPLALQRALLREAVARLKPELRDANFTPIDRAARWSQTAGSGRTADLLGGLCVQIAGDELRVVEWDDVPRLTFERADARQASSVLLNVPGQTAFLAHTFTASLAPTVSLAEIESNPDPFTAYLDASLAPFTLRTRRAGERFRPLGLGGATKLSDFMINKKIPVERRDSWPLLCCGDNAGAVLWVVGHAIAEAGRVTPATRAIIKVQAHS